MTDYLGYFLVVLMVLLIGFCFGYAIGSMNRPTPISRRQMKKQSASEHESDVPYPRYWE